MQTSTPQSRERRSVVTVMVVGFATIFLAWAAFYSWNMWISEWFADGPNYRKAYATAADAIFLAAEHPVRYERDYAPGTTLYVKGKVGRVEADGRALLYTFGTWDRQYNAMTLCALPRDEVAALEIGQGVRVQGDYAGLGPLTMLPHPESRRGHTIILDPCLLAP